MSKKDRRRINGRTAVAVVVWAKSPTRCCWRASSVVTGEEWRLRDGDKKEKKREDGH